MKISDISKIALYGAGRIGGDLAAYFAFKGLEVSVYVRSDAAAERAKLAVQAPVDSYLRYGLVANSAALLRKISITTDLAVAFNDAYFIHENGADILNQKHEIIAEIERYAPEDAIIASSSSCIPAAKIAENAKRPERVIVAHPFGPAYLIPLIEICRGEKTSDEVVQNAVEFYRAHGKTPIVLRKDNTGFIANRLALALWREELALVDEGVCTLEEADNAVCFGPGLNWGIMGPAMGYGLSLWERGLYGRTTRPDDDEDMAGDADDGLPEMAVTPEKWPDISEEQLMPLMANMPCHVGTTKQEIASFRDYMLIEMLKIHQKL